MDRKDIAHEQLNRARDLGSRATTISLVVFLALLLSWKSGLSPKIPDLRNAIVTGKRTANRAEQYSRFEAENKRMIEAFATELRTEPNPGRRRIMEAQQKAFLDNLKKSRTSKLPEYAVSYRLERLSYESKRRLAENVQFKLLGAEFPVSGPWGPVMWLAILALALTNLACSRVAILRAYSKAIRIHCEAGMDPQFLRDSVGDLPVWLAPIQFWIGDEGQPREAVRSAASFRFASQWLSYGVTFGALACVILQVPVSFMGLAYAELTVKSDQVTTVVTRNQWLIDLVFFCGAVTVLTGLSWFYPWKVGDGNARKIRVVERTRRLLLALGATTVASVALSAVYNRTRARLFKPRFKKKEAMKPTEMRPGFYEDRETKVIHYVGEKGVARSLRGIAPSRLEPLLVENLSAHQLSRVHRSAVTPWIRVLAHSLVREHRYSEACELLVSAIEMDQRKKRNAKLRVVLGPGDSTVNRKWESLADQKRIEQRMPNFALYDLLAVVAVRYKQPEYRRRAIKLLEAARFSRPEKQSLQVNLQDRITRENVDLLRLGGRKPKWRLTKHKVGALARQLSDRQSHNEKELLNVIAQAEPNLGRRPSAQARFAIGVKSRLSGLRNPNWKPYKIRLPT